MNWRLGSSMREDGELLSVGGVVVVRAGAHQDLEAGVLAHLLDRRARVQGQELHAPALRVEAEDAERGDHAGDAAEEQAVLAAGVAALQVAGARHEVHALGEAALLVHGEDHHLPAERDDVVGAAAAGQPHLGPRVAADGAGVEVAVPVDLGAADEPHVEEAALGEQERVGDAGQHLGAVGGAHLVGRDRQLARLPHGPDDAALDHHGEPRGVGALGQHRGHHGRADAGEDGGVVAQLARAHHGQQLVGGDAHVVSIRARAAASARRASPKRAR